MRSSSSTRSRARPRASSRRPRSANDSRTTRFAEIQSGAAAVIASMNTFMRALASAAITVILVGSTIAHAQQATLYKRLGGYDAIAAVVDDFVPRVATDPQLGKYFVGAGKDTQMHIRQLAVDFICHATGGPCVYIGRPLKQAHAGLGISEGEWDTAVKHLVATLEKLKVGKPERDELLTAIGGLKADIVEKKS